MKTIIAGSRWFGATPSCPVRLAYPVLCGAVRASGFTITSVISGMASGVDTLGILYANENGLPVDKFYADWKTFGNRAGSIRNEQMAQVGEALIVLWDGQSSGTRRMISSAMARGLKIYCHSIAEFLPQ